MIAFLGRVKISIRANSSSSSSMPTTGRRPTNSGIRPNFMRSSGCRLPRISAVDFLSTFAGNIAGNGRVLVLAADLIDFVDVDDASLAARHIAVGSLQELENDVLDIF